MIALKFIIMAASRELFEQILEIVQEFANRGDQIFEHGMIVIRKRRKTVSGLELMHEHITLRALRRPATALFTSD